MSAGGPETTQFLTFAEMGTADAYRSLIFGRRKTLLFHNFPAMVSTVIEHFIVPSLVTQWNPNVLIAFDLPSDGIPAWP